MGLYQRQRPSPIKIVPTLDRREDVNGTKSPKSPDSPKKSNSPKSPGSPKSSKSASPTKAGLSSTLPPASTQTAAPSQINTQPSGTADTRTTATASSPGPPPLPPTSIAPENTSSSSLRPPPPLPTSIAPENTSSPSPSPPATTQETPSSEQPIRSNTQRTVPTQTKSSGSAVTSQSTELATALPVLSPSESSSESPSESPSSTLVRKPVSSPSPTLPSSSQAPAPTKAVPPSITSIAFVPAQSELEDEMSGIGRERHHEDRPIISKGAEAAAVTLSIMGIIALLVGLVIFIKRRKRRQNESSMRHAEDAFNPGNNGSLHAPETAHIDDNLGAPRPSLAHMTKSSTNSDALFGGSHYQRPETVSNSSNPSRMRAVPSVAPPQPTPNPFADPPLHKAYDQLRGRPRSTTLTDRGSWIKNPFKDPASERFDPFGELQEKARAERRKYVEDARREAEEMRRREEEQEYLEQERMGLTVPGRDDRKGSDVTVGGVGVLDRSNSGRYR